MAVQIVRATKEHVAELASRIRESDQRECLAICGKSAQQGLWESFYNAEMAWAILAGEEIVAVAGCSGASPWLLASDQFDKIRWTIARRCKQYIGYMLRKNDWIFNYVDARNAASIRWLKWCGFTVMPSEPIGMDGEHFHMFIMSAGREIQCVSQQRRSDSKALHPECRPGLLTERPRRRTSRRDSTQA
jgi:hypothetical protein